MASEHEPVEAIVYYTGTIAVHVDLVTRNITRVVQLREEIHPSDDKAMLVTDGGLVDCDQLTARRAETIAESTVWPGAWEFGY